MIKSIFKIFGALIAIILLATITFFFYGSSAGHPQGDYSTVQNEASLPAAKDTLSIITFNMGYLSGMSNNLPVVTDRAFFKENEDSLIQFLNHIDPDIVAFQEIDFDSERSHKVDQLQLVAGNTLLKNSARAVNWDKRYVPFPYWPVSNHFGSVLSGQAVVSRYPLGSTESVKLEERLDAPFYYKAFYLDRLMQIVTVKINDRKLYLLNVHLEAFDAETRMKQIITVKNKYNELAKENAVILLGDFNAVEGDEQDQTIRMILEGENISQAISMSGSSSDKRSLYTYSSRDPIRKIDYIFYNNDKIILHDATVLSLSGQISDHIPVMMRFSVI